MKTARPFFLGITLLLYFVQFSTAQTSYTWTGGANSNWNEAANWSPAGVPGMIDTAVISKEGDYTVNIDIDTTVAKIVLGGSSGTQTLSLSGRTLAVNNDLEITSNGLLSVTNSTITGAGALRNSGTLQSSTGIFNTEFVNDGFSTFTGTNEFSDSIITYSNSTLNIPSGSYLNFISEKGFENNGLIDCQISNYWGGGVFGITNGSLVNNVGGELIIRVTGGLSSASSPFKLAVQLENNGNVLVDHRVVMDKPDAKHVNNGELRLRNHALTITQAGTSPVFTNNGNIAIEENSTLKIDGGTFEYLSGAMEVQGTFEINKATVNFIPEYTNFSSLNIHQSTLNCTESFTNQEYLNLINTTVNGSQFFTNQDTLMARGTSFNMDLMNEGMAIFAGVNNINDTLITTPNSTLQVTSYSNIPMQFTSASGFTNHGLIQSLTYNYWAGGFITVTDGILVNDAQGVMEISVPGNISSSATALRLITTLENNGEMNISHITNLDQPSAIHTNNGTIRVTDRSFSIIQTGTTPSFNTLGEIATDSSGTLSINGGTFNYDAGIIDNQGKLSVTNATLNIVPEFINTSAITMNTSILNCTAPFTNEGDLDLVSTTINGDSFFTNHDTITANGIELNMDFDNHGMASLKGALVFKDTLITNPNSTLNISGMNFTSEKGLTNNGLLQCISTNYWGGGIMAVATGSLTNNVGGVFNILVQGGLSSASSPLNLAFHLVNKGELWIDHKSTLSKASVIHENNGVIKLTNHAFTIDQAGTSFINQSSGTMHGNGTIHLNGVNFTNSGAINPGLSPGLLHINGDVSQDDTSQMHAELGGNTAGSSYDQLKISGSFQIDGQLNIELIDGFNPAPGDIFNIVGFTSATGAYDDILGVYPGTGIRLTVDQTSTNVNVTAVAHDNNPPVVKSPVADLELDEDFESIQVVQIDTIFDDPDLVLGDHLDYTIELLDQIVTVIYIDKVISLASIADTSGSTSIVFIATDAGNEIARDTVNILVNAVNDAPVITSPIADMELDEDFEMSPVADLDTVFSDADLYFGDHLLYSFVLLDEIVTASITDNVLRLASIPDVHGSGDIVLIASDEGSEMARDTVNIQVAEVNDAPGAFPLVSPADGSTVTESGDLIFSWESAGDVDGDVIDYTLNLSLNGWDSVITQITDTVFTFINVSILEDDATFQWSVTASDGQMSTSCIEDFSFTTPEATYIHSSLAGPVILKQNYPNPFSRSTSIVFSLITSEYMTINIYNLRGELVRTLVDGALPAGNYTYQLDLGDLAGGIYFYKVEAGSTTLVKKMTKIQ